MEDKESREISFFMSLCFYFHNKNTADWIISNEKKTPVKHPEFISHEQKLKGQGRKLFVIFVFVDVQIHLGMNVSADFDRNAVFTDFLDLIKNGDVFSVNFKSHIL